MEPGRLADASTRPVAARRTWPARRYSVDITGSGSFHFLYEGPLTILEYCSGLLS